MLVLFLHKPNWLVSPTASGGMPMVALPTSRRSLLYERLLRTNLRWDGAGVSAERAKLASQKSTLIAKFVHLMPGLDWRGRRSGALESPISSPKPRYFASAIVYPSFVAECSTDRPQDSWKVKSCAPRRQQASDDHSSASKVYLHVIVCYGEVAGSRRSECSQLPATLFLARSMF